MLIPIDLKNCSVKTKQEITTLNIKNKNKIVANETFFTGFISKRLIKTTKGQQIMNKQIEILKKFLNQPSTLSLIYVFK